MTAVGCQCVKRHLPAGYVGNKHHMLPLSWGGQTVPSNLVLICPNTHTAVHRLIDALLKGNGVADEWGLSSYVRRLAHYAWDHRIPGHPTPLTSLAEHR